MAIPFLNNLDISNNQLLNAKLQITGTAPNAAAGQIYFDSTVGDETAKYYSNVTDTWVSLKEYSFPTGAYVTGAVTGTFPKPIITFDLNALDGTAAAGERYLTKTNKWAEISSIPGTYTWSIQGDTGGPTAVVSSDVVDFAGGTNVTTSLAGTTLTINSTDQFVGTLTGIGAGTYISVDNSTPAVPIINALGTEAATADRLVARDSSGYGYVVTPASGDSTTKIATTAFVQAALTGLLEFKGGFRADTGQITSGANYVPGVGNETYLWGASRVAVEIGDYYIASGAFSGDFYGDADYPLTPGDSVIGVTDALVDASVVGDWAVVQSDTDLATLATVGIGNVNAGTGISVAYAAGTATVTNTDTNTSNTFSGLIGNGTLTSLQITSGTHGLGTDSTSFMIQLVDNIAGDTVYADVFRGSSGLVTIVFAVAPASNSIRVLIQKIG